MTIGHLPSGYVAAYLTRNLFGLKLKITELRKFIFFWMLGAVFPDIDTLPFLMEGASLSAHRTFITHTPFLYILVGIVLFGYGLTLEKNEGRKQLFLCWFAFLFGAILHLAGDSFFYGVRWFYPISNSYYGIFPGASISFSNVYEMMSKYVVSIFFLPDLVFILLALVIFFGKKFGLSKKKFGWI